MATVAACVKGAQAPEISIPRVALRRQEPREPVRQDPHDSPFLHPAAADALVMASKALEDGPRPIAVVLEDGTVRTLEEQGTGAGRFSSGLLTGRGWTLWWERRNWAKA
jgi:hypothetical protein